MRALCLCVYVLLHVEARGHLWCSQEPTYLEFFLVILNFVLCVWVYTCLYVYAPRVFSACQDQKGVSASPGTRVTRNVWAAILMLETEPGSSGRLNPLHYWAIPLALTLYLFNFSYFCDPVLPGTNIRPLKWEPVFSLGSSVSFIWVWMR